MAGKREFTALFEPTDKSSLAGYTWTKDHLVLNVMEDVKNRLSVLTPGKDGWAKAAFVGAPSIGTVGVGAVDSDDSNAVWLTATDFLTPTTLAIAGITHEGGGQPPEVLKSNPAFFDGSKHVMEQHFATSRDGTKVPYFLVRPKDLAFDGKAPTLLYGYGGFTVSMTPSYSGSIGKAWLERGWRVRAGQYGGDGEYGPRWHEAAQANRHKAYEDFAASLTTWSRARSPRPSTDGGSNGVLMGNMLAQYPEKFGAIVVRVPLLGMSATATCWPARRGWPVRRSDPTSDWAFIKTSRRTTC
jgi:prolyl oligopeptidase